jgi:hypothetical protein
MSDYDGIPRLADSAPQAGRAWSEQDRRTLVITLTGTLVANVATVILVGAAIGFVHFAKHHGGHSSLLSSLVLCGFGLIVIALGIFVRRIDRDDRSLRVTGGLVFAMGLLLVVESVLFLTGLAAGVK